MKVRGYISLVDGDRDIRSGRWNHVDKRDFFYGIRIQITESNSSH